MGKRLCHIASLFKFAFACDLVDASPPPQNEFISIPLASIFRWRFGSHEIHLKSLPSKTIQKSGTRPSKAKLESFFATPPQEF